MFGPNQSFEPRVGTAQLIFGVIYTIITLIALCLAYYVTLEGRTPYLHLFMALLFAIMALKSFIIYKRVKTLMANGQYAEAEVSSIEPVRGITVIKGTCALPNGDSIEIESRLVGETAAKELKAYLAEQKQNKLPALVVGVDGPRPRGMFTVKCLHGHLIEASAHLKSAPPKDSAADDEATARAKAATRAAEEQKQLEAEQAQAEQAQAEQAAPEQAKTNEVQPEVAPRDDKRDAAIMDALAQAEKKK
ncbi:MAG: hypothetical protein ROM54_08485 [Anaerobiospirillum sp.]|nr:hypothetical protein [Anaerobiospirillum sp.]